ncbi:MAG: lysozyme [Pseudomonadota bacterium]
MAGFALIPNWKDVALKSHSMREQYLSMLCLAAPDLIYLLFSLDTDPRLWWAAAFALLIYGTFGRVVDQGIDRSRVNNPIWIVAVALLLVLGAFWQSDRVNLDPVEQTTKVMPQGVSDRHKQFLKVAVPFVAKWEGLRTTAYKDIVGVWTVCYGETKGVKSGDSYTKAQCDAMLAKEILSYRNGLHGYFSPETKRQRLPVRRDVAFASFAYNVGISGAGKSTAVRRLNAANIVGACEALTWWNKAGGRVVRGLVRRRTDEHALCMAGVA